MSQPATLGSLPLIPKLVCVSTPDLREFSTRVDRTILSETSFMEVDDEQAHLQVMRGRLEALRSILGQLSSVLDSVKETHMYVTGQVHDLEMYIGGLAPADIRPGVGDSGVVETRIAQKRGQNKGNFWSKLHLSR